MKLDFNWKRILLISLDVCIFIYLLFAITSWNETTKEDLVCTKVVINIADESNNGFLNSAEVKKLLEEYGIYPLSTKIKDINIRNIEEQLVRMPFVNTAQCYVTTDGHVCITVTQRTPIMRVKSSNGEDYYVDDNGGVMPNSEYTSDMIIVTGKVSRDYACKYVCLLAQCIMSQDLWKNQIEQINITDDQCVELVPRVGDHVVNIGELPTNDDAKKRKEMVTEFVNNQLQRLKIFYKQGLSQAGWNKYDYVNLEYSNQIVCRRRGTGSPVLHALDESIGNDSTTVGIANTTADSLKTTNKPDASNAKNTEKKTNDKAEKNADSKKNSTDNKKAPADNKKVTDTKKPSTDKKPEAKKAEAKKAEASKKTDASKKPASKKPEPKKNDKPKKK